MDINKREKNFRILKDVYGLNEVLKKYNELYKNNVDNKNPINYNGIHFQIINKPERYACSCGFLSSILKDGACINCNSDNFLTINNQYMSNIIYEIVRDEGSDDFILNRHSIKLETSNDNTEIYLSMDVTKEMYYKDNELIYIQPNMFFRSNKRLIAALKNNLSDIDFIRYALLDNIKVNFYPNIFITTYILSLSDLNIDEWRDNFYLMRVVFLNSFNRFTTIEDKDEIIDEVNSIYKKYPTIDDWLQENNVRKEMRKVIMDKIELDDYVALRLEDKDEIFLDVFLKHIVKEHQIVSTINNSYKIYLTIKNLKDEEFFKFALSEIEKNLHVYGIYALYEFKYRCDFLKKNNIELTKDNLENNYFKMIYQSIVLKERMNIPEDKVDIFINLIDDNPLDAIQFIANRRKLTKKEVKKANNVLGVN